MLSELAVRPTSAVRKYADLAAPDPLTAGRELGVDAVLEGNIQKDGDLVRVTVQLLRSPMARRCGVGNSISITAICSRWRTPSEGRWLTG
jgi:hypothetical protein